MNIVGSSLRMLGVLCLAGSLVPAVASAAGGGESRANTPASNAQSGGTHVFQRISHELANGCTYRALIRGEMSRGDNNMYSAQLTVLPRVQCPGEPDHVAGARAVRFTNLRKDIAEAHIDMAARVPIREAGERCNYTPEVSLRGNSIGARSVTFACARPTGRNVGGGPGYGGK